MQPILAESAPVRRRALVLAVALTVAASIASVAVATPRPQHTRWHRHHHLPYNGQCPYGYVYVPR
ncbi:MAG TPA: hypothetical protein VHW23_37800 [Kofleriaceae bacterium]|jgi:hypothetical protein|nr:hypothetical protein [Kofleriaceae bacterium]